MTENQETADRRRRILDNWRCAALWALVVSGTLVPLCGAWLSGLTLINRDDSGLYAPLRWLAGQALREGRLPLWNPFCAAGMPFLGETIHGVLHPLSLAVALIFPGDGLDPLIGAYLLAAGLGACMFARSLGASRPASALAGFAYGLSGFALSMTDNLVYCAGTASIPWVLAGLRWAGRDGSPAAFAGGALAVATIAFSGDIQGLSVAVLAGLVLAFEAGGRRGLAVSLGAVCAGMLLAGIQLAPSWNFLQLTNRALPLPEYDLRQWDLEPWRLIEAVSPGFFWRPGDGYLVAPVFRVLGHPTEFKVPFTESVYVGLAVLMLAAAGVRVSRTTRWLTALAALLLWFAMGGHLGARLLQDLLPVVSGFRYGEKFLPEMLLCLAVCAALGADRLVHDGRAGRRFRNLALLATLSLTVAWMLMVLGAPLESLGVEEGHAIQDHLLSGIPHAAAAALLLAGCLQLALQGREKAALVGLAVLAWVSALLASPYALRPGHPEARITAAPQPLAASSPGPRVLNLHGPPEHPPQRKEWDSVDQLNFDVLTSLGANTNARYRVDNMDVDTGLYPIRWFLLRKALGRDFPRFARRYGVTHVIFPQPRTAEGVSQVAAATGEGGSRGSDAPSGMQIWSVPHRAWACFPNRVVASPDLDRAMQALRNLTERESDTAVVEGDGPFQASHGEVLSLSRGVERLEIVARTDADATLVVNDAYWPGWRARIDGRDTPIYPADVLVRAIRWPAGRHTLVMEYHPPELRTGMLLSCAGLALLAAGCLVLRRRAVSPHGAA